MELPNHKKTLEVEFPTEVKAVLPPKSMFCLCHHQGRVQAFPKSSSYILHFCNT